MTTPTPTPVKILLVDDLDENLTALEIVLGGQDAALLRARSGAEALELLLTNDVALALVDVQMPEMDGFELAELMRGAPRTANVPIIFVTAGVHDPNRMFRGYDAGAVDFLYKPLEPYIVRHKTTTFLELYRQRRALEQALRLNEELMAVVGHDLRNPLHAILMTAELMAATSGERSVIESAARIKTSGKRMVRMIDELLDLTRARLGGGIPIEPRSTDLAVVTSKIVAEHQAGSPSRVLLFRCGGDLVGEWDGDRIEQALSNLVGNAIRHGDPKGLIRVEARGGDGEVVISVHNDGHIKADIVEHVFDAFHSGRKHTAQDQGLGLGLYIVQQIALAHGGSVEAESAEAAGTTFRIRLPRRRLDAQSLD